MTNIFVLCTGRCGSTTFSKATAHATNVTSGHETRTHLIGEDRFSYPLNHVEADNRLTWFLGRMERYWGDDAKYVHLIRNREATARSYLARSEYGIMRAYSQGIILKKRVHPNDVYDIALDYIDNVTANIEAFLSRRKCHIRVELENVEVDYARFWQWAALEGDLPAALSEWSISYNAGVPADRRTKEARTAQN